MPTYEFACKRCEDIVSVRCSVQEKQAGLHLECASCGGSEFRQVFGGIPLTVSNRPDPAGGGCAPGSGCCGPRRSGL